MRLSVPILLLLNALAAVAQKPAVLPRVQSANFAPAIAAQIERAQAEAHAHPNDAAGVGRFCMTLHAYQKYSEAEVCYRRARQLEPQRFDWQYLLGLVQFSQGEYDLAASDLRSALKLRPDYVPAQLRVAESLAALGKWAEAERAYRAVVAQCPGCAQAWYGLGRAQAALGEHQPAIQSYKHALELFPTYGAAHFALAAELRKSGDADRAEQQLGLYKANMTAEPTLEDPLLERIHELNGSALVHMQRSAELANGGNLDGAIAEQEMALQIEPDNVQAHINLISLYGGTGNVEKAKQHFLAATQLSPNRADAWYDYGVLMMHASKFDDAERAFRKALEIDPDYAEAHNQLGIKAEETGHLDEAEREFRAAIAAQPDRPQPRFELGRLLANERKFPEAIQQFTRALASEKAQPESRTIYLYALAATYARAGDRAHSITFFREARESAVAHNQNRLINSIERDMQTLGITN